MGEREKNLSLLRPKVARAIIPRQENILVDVWLVSRGRQLTLARDIQLRLVPHVPQDYLHPLLS